MELRDFKDVVYSTLMVGYICASGDPNVVHVNSASRSKTFMFEDDVTIDVVHHRLERCWRIGESKVHNCRFEESVSGFKGCLLLIPFTDSYIVVSPANVELRIDVCVTEVSDEVRD